MGNSSKYGVYTMTVDNVMYIIYIDSKIQSKIGLDVDCRQQWQQIVWLLLVVSQVLKLSDEHNCLSIILSCISVISSNMAHACYLYHWQFWFWCVFFSFSFCDCQTLYSYNGRAINILLKLFFKCSHFAFQIQRHYIPKPRALAIPKQ